MDDQGQAGNPSSEQAATGEQSREDELRSRASLLAAVALGLTAFALFAAVIGVLALNILKTGMRRSTALLVVLAISGIMATSGIVLGNVALAGMRRARLKRPPVLARVALILGYGWWMVVYCFALPVVAVFIEGPRIILSQEGRQPWSTLVAALLILVVTQFCIFVERAGIGAPLPYVSIFGALELGFLATWALFSPRRDLVQWRFLYAGVFYAFGLGSVIAGWLVWGAF